MPSALKFSNPLFWAVMIGWIMSVVLHEFAHGLVAWWGGDYTIRERGGLTLNPLQYVDPVFSIVLPIIFLAMGGIPLPGGSTYVRRDLIRSRGWESAMSLAGPAMNLLLFFACALPLHPRFGWLDPMSPEGATPTQLMLATTAFLQFFSVILNLVPVPPLDGFQALNPWMSSELRRKLAHPPAASLLFVAFVAIVWQLPVASAVYNHLMLPLLSALGFGDSGYFFGRAVNQTLFG